VVEARAAAPEFARVLLLEQRRKSQRWGRRVRNTLAVLIPGYGLLAFRKLFVPVVLLGSTAALVTAGLDAGSPFAYEPLVRASGEGLPLAVPLVLGAVILAISILGYLAEVRRADARVAAALRPARPRNPAAPRRSTPAAA
jgi:hypothetical protein